MAGTVQTDLKAITLTTAEISNAQGLGLDPVGMLSGAIEAAADCTAILKALANALPTGSNKTAIGTTIVAELA